MFENTVRRLKRKNQILSKSKEDTEPLSSGPSEQETSSILLSVVSPSAKKEQNISLNLALKMRQSERSSD